MVYHYKAYRDVAAFLANGPKSSEKTAYTLCDRCGGQSNAAANTARNERCFGCLFCLFFDTTRREEFSALWGRDAIRLCAQQAFCGQCVAPPPAAEGTTLADFFAANPDCLPHYAAGILHHTCSAENRVSLQVPLCAEAPALGTLGACLAAPNLFLLVDTATAAGLAADAEPFRRRAQACAALFPAADRPCLFLTLLGGPEPSPAELAALAAQLGPETHQLTAAALWSLCCRFLTNGAADSWDTLLPKAFAPSRTADRCLGLVSAGRVLVQGGRVVCEPLR